MPTSPLMAGYLYKVLARYGLDADTPSLEVGEIGWSTDKKHIRMGDDSSTPPKIPTTKSTDSYDFSTSSFFKFAQIQMATNGTVDGVDISKLNAVNGFLVRKGNNNFGSAQIVSSNASLQITNPDGVNGNVDIKISQSILDLLNTSTFLTSVTTTAVMTGAGTSTDPLDIRAATTTLTGVHRFATDIEAGAGVLNTVGITPYNLTHIAANSNVALYLTSLIEQNIEINTDATLTGSGNTASPLSVIQATISNKGATKYSTAALVNAAASTDTAITPNALAGLTAGSTMANVIANAIGIALPLDYTDIKMTGPGVLGQQTSNANQPVQVVPFTTRALIIAGNNAHNNYVVNGAALKEFFPNGLVKTNAFATVSLPSPTTSGKGAIAFDDTKDRLVFSDGTAWRSIGQIVALHMRNNDVETVMFNEVKGFTSYTQVGSTLQYVFTTPQQDTNYSVLTATGWQPHSSDRDSWVLIPATKTINGFSIKMWQDVVTMVLVIRY